MADINDVQEAVDYLERALRDLASGNLQQADIIARLNQLQNQNLNWYQRANRAWAEWTQANPMKSAALGFAKDLGVAAAATAGAARQNRESFESLNPLIDATANAFRAIPILGDGLAGALSGVGRTFTAEVQETVNSFQRLGQVGAIGAQGMTGLQQQATAAGLSLTQFSSAIADNARELAFATGSTVEGARAIAGIRQAAGPLESSFLSLGIGFQQQAEFFADFLAVQTRIGRNQTRDYNMLAEGALRYATELDTLAKLTGASRQELQRSVEAQQSDIRFRALTRQLEQQGQGELLRNIRMTTQALGQIGGRELQEGVQDALVNAGTPAAQNFFAVFGDRAVQLINGIYGGQDAYDAIRNFQQASQDVSQIMNANLLKLNTPFDQLALSVFNLADAQLPQTKEQFNSLINSQRKQMQGSDQQTRAIIQAQINLQQFARELDKIVRTYLPNFANVLVSVTDTMRDAMIKLNEYLGGGNQGGGPPRNTGGGSPRILPNGTVAPNVPGSPTYDPTRPGTLPDPFGPGGQFGPPVNPVTRQFGGPVLGNKLYLVGEDGPEFFIPDTPGMVVSNRNSQKLSDLIRQLGDSRDAMMQSITPSGTDISGLGTALRSLAGSTAQVAGPQSSYRTSLPEEVALSGARTGTTGTANNNSMFGGADRTVVDILQRSASALENIVTNTKSNADSSKQILQSANA